MADSTGNTAMVISMYDDWGGGGDNILSQFNLYTRQDLYRLLHNKSHLNKNFNYKKFQTINHLTNQKMLSQ